MRITRPRATKISQLAVDADLNMAAHNITLGAGQTVDGRDVGADLVVAATILAEINASVEVAKIANAQLVDLAWAKVLKAGSSLADFATRSAGDLNSGDLLAARMNTNVMAAVNNGGDLLAARMSTNFAGALNAAARTFTNNVVIDTAEPSLWFDLSTAHKWLFKVYAGTPNHLYFVNQAAGDFAIRTAGNAADLFRVDSAGALTLASTVDGRDIDTDGTKLDTVETNAKDDQTGAQIKTLYEAEANAFTDAKNTKLAGIATGATVDIGTVGGLTPADITKVASDVLRNSHDNEVIRASDGYGKVKTITFTNGIKGTLRIKFDLRHEIGGNTANGRVYKNGGAIGAIQSTTNEAYVTKTQDIDVGTVEAGETLELWLQTDTTNCRAENFRIYHSNAELNAVATVNS